MKPDGLEFPNGVENKGVEEGGYKCIGSTEIDKKSRKSQRK